MEWSEGQTAGQHLNWWSAFMYIKSALTTVLDWSVRMFWSSLLNYFLLAFMDHTQTSSCKSCFYQRWPACGNAGHTAVSAHKHQLQKHLERQTDSTENQVLKKNTFICFLCEFSEGRLNIRRGLMMSWRGSVKVLYVEKQNCSLEV